MSGADTLVGERVLQRLLTAGGEVVAVVRRRASEAIPTGVIRVVAEHTGGIWGDWAVGCRAAVHLGPGLGERPADDGRFCGVSPRDTAALLAACQRHGITRVVLVSCLGASPAATSARQRAAGAAEEALRTSALALTVLRPAWLAAPGPSLVARVLHAVQMGRLIPLYGGGVQTLQTVSADDVAAAVTRCLEDDHTCGQTFELAAGIAIPFLEVIRRIATAARQRARTISIPRCLAFPLVGLMQRRAGTLLTRDELLALWSETVADITSAQATFGPLASGLDLIPAPPGP